MATYKVIQDIEAEDKLIFNLSFRQFVYAFIAAIFGYITYAIVMASHHKVWYFGILTLPVTAFFGFLAFPFMRDQPTEVWALAKLRFIFKPQQRIWDQDGAINLVTVTAPKKVEVDLTDGLSQTEVKSRLQALATTLDTRGWAVKNITSNPAPRYLNNQNNDRLINLNPYELAPQEQEVHDFEDMLDSSNPDYKKMTQLVDDNTRKHKQQLIDSVDRNFTPPTTTTALPDLSTGYLGNSSLETSNMRTLLSAPVAQPKPTLAPELTPITPPAIPDIISASTDNLNSVSTLSKEVNTELPVANASDDGEVVISLR